jgi:peptidoglycan/xylan/chitin deacetylase (PgdA/CDA1 family)
MLLGGGAAAAKQLLDKVASVGGEPAPAAVMTKLDSAPLPKASAFISSGPSEGRRVALTFDDGPTPGVTDRILDELHRRNLRATFFIIGSKVGAAPDLVRRAFAEGHTVANHSFTHPNLSRLPDAQILDELRKTQDTIADLLNVRPVWFRPPYGGFRGDQVHLATSLGLRAVLWSLDPHDWSKPNSESIIQLVSQNVQPGSIVLCHDLHPVTADALPAILDDFERASLAQVNLDQIFA